MNQVSTKEASLKRELVKVYAEIDEKAWDEEKWHCWSCGKSRSLQHSHACSRGQNKKLMLDPDNIFLQCTKCHGAWENREWEKIVKFANLKEMLTYVMEHDEYQYWQLIEGINKYLDSKENNKFTYQYKIMSRYSLRNQSKIQKSLGDDFLLWLNKSLKNHFENTDKIEELEYKNEKYKVIHVQNIQPKTDSVFELYVISKIYDIYNLTYKSCMS